MELIYKLYLVCFEYFERFWGLTGFWGGGLEAGAEGEDQDHSEDDVGGADELPVGGRDLLEARGVFGEEAAAEKDAIDGEDFGRRGEVDGPQDDVGGGDEEEDQDGGHFL